MHTEIDWRDQESLRELLVTTDKESGVQKGCF